MDETKMQHGYDWNGEEIGGWIATEKFDGCRAYWDGQQLWSRGGAAIAIPEAWRANLPAGVALDGEIYDGIDGLSRCVSAVRYGRFTPSMRFIAFDAPAAGGPYTDRIRQAGKFRRGILDIVLPVQVSGLDECLSLLRSVISRKGEGLVLRKNTLRYEPGRFHDILKAKKAMFGRAN